MRVGAIVVGSAVAFTCVATLPGCEEKITQESYVQITPGMTLGQVEAMLGGKGERQEVTGMSVSGAGIAGGSSSTQEIYVWKKNRKEISVTMGGGKVVSVSKAGF